MDNKIAARLFRRGLEEKLADYRKSAFVPMGKPAEKTGQQAPGPGGAQVDPAAAGGAPMDPMAAGGAPMDPMAAMGGAPPADPMAAMGGAPPMDPAAGGAPPMDPAAGAPPMDPMAAMGGMPPLPPDAGAGGEAPPPPPPLDGAGGEDGGGGGLTKADAETVDTITRRTMDIVRETLDMVGKTKAPKDGASGAAPAEPDPKSQPGPVTGQPGFDPSMLSGPLKMASAAVARGLAKRSSAPRK